MFAPSQDLCLRHGLAVFPVLTQPMKKLRPLFLTLSLALSFQATQAMAAPRHLATFDAAWTLIRDRFFDPGLNGVDWSAARAEFRPRVEAAGSDDAFAGLMTQMLGRLKTSHTTYLPPGDPMLDILLDVYIGNPDLDSLRKAYEGNQPRLVGIGLFARNIDGKYLVDAVLDASPAAKAGLKTGDEILSVEGEPFHPLTSFRDRIGKTVTVGYRRTAGGEISTVPVPVESRPALESLNEASRASIRMIERGGKKITYLRFWSLAGEAPQEILSSAPLEEADALVLDVRALTGGGGTQLLDQLDQKLGRTCIVARNASSCGPASFRGRTVLLTDHHTRSSAELMAYAFRRSGFGLIVGTKTAGAVSGGQIFPLPDGGGLYVAVVALTVDGQSLEGRGVMPDLEIRPLSAYAGGRDLQFEAAVDAAACLVGSRTKSC